MTYKQKAFFSCIMAWVFTPFLVGSSFYFLNVMEKGAKYKKYKDLGEAANYCKLSFNKNNDFCKWYRWYS